MNIEFVEELPHSKRESLSPFADALRGRPGVWAKWPTKLTKGSARGLPSLLKRGGYPALPSSEFEAVHRQGMVFVRYIGKGETR